MTQLNETAASDCTPTAADTTTQADDSTASELVQAGIDQLQVDLEQIVPAGPADVQRIAQMQVHLEEWRAERRAA